MKNIESMSNGSIGQKRIFQMIRDLYPRYTIIWEQPIESIGLRYDIFIKELGIAIEVDGIQHEVFNKFFHKDVSSAKKGFLLDKKKNNFSIEHGIKLIRINYKRSLSINIEELKSLIDNTEYPINNSQEYTYCCLG